MELIAERDRLEGKLTRLWNWLERNPYSEEYDRRERVWLNTLKKYERTCNEIEGRG